MNVASRFDDTLFEGLLNAIPQPIFVVAADGAIAYANTGAERLLGSSAATLQRHKLDDFVPSDSPLLNLIGEVRDRSSSVTEYRVDVAFIRPGAAEHLVDIFVGPIAERPDLILVMFKERTVAEKMDRQMTYRGAARSVTGLAAMLAHEIKNPLSGIRGAAQLLESGASESDVTLTKLITSETDRIVKLVDRMEIFSDERPVDRTPVNIHIVLDHVRTLATNGFASELQIEEDYDPSLPPVFANRDQLVQIFLNLVKNACEAVSDQGRDGKVRLTTAFRPGVRLSVPGSRERVSLPMEFCVHDNGSGVPQDILPYIFDPFITSKTNGSGLGLALVAKLVNEHGGIIECDTGPHGTTFRILMPAYREDSNERKTASKKRERGAPTQKANS